MKIIEIVLPLGSFAELKKSQNKIKSLINLGYTCQNIGGMAVILTK